MKKTIKAMVMSAGMGSRLEPLTLNIPKPLLPIANIPVMDILFKRLVSYDIKDVICNTYYLSEQIISRYKNNDIGINFNYVNEDKLSGTAGGVKKCQFFFDKDEPFVVFSADGLTNVDIARGIEIHRKSNAIATIGIKKVPKEDVSHLGVVVFDETGFVTDFQEKPAIEEAKSNYINTGIYIFDYRIFDYIPENTFYDFAKNVFPELLKEHEINTFKVDEYWSDVGTIEQYKQSTQDIFSGMCQVEHAPIVKTLEGMYISDTADIDSTVHFIGNSTIGSNVVIGENTVIKDCIIWDNVQIGSNLYISNCVIASGSVVMTDLSDCVTGWYEKIEKQMEKIST